LAAKITSRDFKRGRPSGLRFDLGRWKEFGLGLAIGLSLSLFILVWQNFRDERARETTETPKPEPRSAPSTSAAEESGKDLSFYTLLQKTEVVLPEKDREVTRELDSKPVTITRPGAYVLQAGAYRRQEDAERLQALLKKQGFDSSVQRVAVDDDVWHRVRLGPITDLAELNSLRARLRTAEIDDVLVIRVGD
jgi:cell division protein FtsN